MVSARADTCDDREIYEHLQEGNGMKNLPKWLVVVSVFILIVWAVG